MRSPAQRKISKSRREKLPPFRNQHPPSHPRLRLWFLPDVRRSLLVSAGSSIVLLLEASLWVISRTIVEAVQLSELVKVLPWFEVHFEATRIMQTWADLVHSILVRRKKRFAQLYSGSSSWAHGGACVVARRNDSTLRGVALVQQHRR